MADFKVSLEALLPFCEEGLAVHPPAVLLAFEGPEASWIHYVPRLLLLLEGRNHIQFQRQGKLEEMTVSAPAIFFCARSGWLVNVREECPTRSLSFSFYPSYIRAMHVDYDGIHKPPTERDVFYHTRNPLSTPGAALLDAIERLHEAGHDDIAGELLRPLFDFTVRELRASAAAPVLMVRRLWDQINTFMRDHREEPVARAELARLFQISPGYVSELSKQYTGESFSMLKLRYQLEHAESLLLHTRLSVDEIAERSGFSTANYFIRRFRKVHGMTPHVYRNHPPEPFIHPAESVRNARGDLPTTLRKQNEK